MKKNRIVFLIFIGMIIANLLVAQEIQRKQKTYQLLPYLSYGIDVSMGDLSDRFGYNFGFHGGLDFVFKNNMTFGLFVKNKFGDKLKEDVLHTLRVANGEILTTTGTYANLVLNERGLFVGGQFGKLFPFEIRNKKFDVKLDFGIGYMSHYVSIENSFDDVPQLKGDLTKGFDRLTKGFGINQSIQFHYIAPNNWRLFFSIESIQGFTSLARNIQFDQSHLLNNDRIDVYTGFHMGFVMPFSFGSDGDEIRY